MAPRSGSQPVETGAAQAYEEKHLDLLKAAAALFARRGFHDASVRDLARETGRSLAGLYYYFSGKEELLYQIQHHCYSTLIASVGPLLEKETTPRGRLLAFISNHLGFFRHNMDEMKVLAHEDLTLGGEYGERILELKREYSATLAGIVSEFAAETPGEFARPDPDMAAFILFGAMNWLYTWPRRLRDLPAEELATAIAQIFLCGYPGCPVSSLAGIEREISCSPREFWKLPAPPDTGRGK